MIDAAWNAGCSAGADDDDHQLHLWLASDAVDRLGDHGRDGLGGLSVSAGDPGMAPESPAERRA